MLGDHPAPRRDEWIDSGVMATLQEMVLETYDRTIGLELSDVAVDGRITKAPCGGERAGKSPVGRGKQGLKRSTVVDASGIPLGAIAAPANRHDSPLLDETLDALEVLGPLPEQMSVHLDRGYDSVEKAWAEGRAMTLGEAVAYALSEAGATERQRP